MVKTADLVTALRCCASDEIDGCLRCPLRTAGDCLSWMKRTSADKIEELVDRCARYAEEIAVLRRRQRWIPVTERLPGEGERVLASDGVFVGEAYLNSFGIWCRSYGVLWRVVCDPVTRWMPLPGTLEVSCNG